MALLLLARGSGISRIDLSKFTVAYRAYEFTKGAAKDIMPVAESASTSSTSIWVRLVDDADTDRGVVMSARDEVLLQGLIDWVALCSVHGDVAEGNPGEPLAVVQDKVLDLIRSLVTDGLFELGDLATPDHRFGAWDAPLDESIQQIRDVYVNQFDDDPEWWFYCWLKLTEKGRKLAEAIEASRDSAQGS